MYPRIKLAEQISYIVSDLCSDSGVRLRMVWNDVSTRAAGKERQLSYYMQILQSPELAKLESGYRM